MIRSGELFFDTEVPSHRLKELRSKLLAMIQEHDVRGAVLKGSYDAKLRNPRIANSCINYVSLVNLQFSTSRIRC